ncbi:MAG TPA: hypothetical protein DCR40_00050 [Prolixibacteraceae bacterium]|nr:hypothetical protein [Prolixibacteraceae bacterium]
MGLSFHYNGRIADPVSLPGLIEEVEDIAKAFNWKYFVFDRQFPENTYGKADYNQNIYGICFTPPNCETVDVCFLSNGRMSSLSHLQFWGKTDVQAEREYLYMLSVKTQYAGVETHQFIIQLFRYLDKKYLADFTMSDEGEYWETNDKTLLETIFKTYTDLINGFASAIENYPIQSGENIESYFERLMKQINDMKKLGDKLD